MNPAKDRTIAPAPQSRQGDDTGGWGSNSPAAAVNNTNG